MKSILREGREWEIAPLPDGSLVRTIQTSLGCSTPFAILLAQRGGAAWGSLIDPGLRNFHSASLLPDIDKAVARLSKAIERKERIFVHGDFDADGLSGAAVLYRALRPLLPANTIKVEVGDRSHGHGLSRAFVLRAIDEGFSLVVTADCGVANCEEIAELRTAGIDTIVTDHHLPLMTLPEAVAIVNPQLPGSRYPNPYLAGVGVAYKLIEALYKHLGRPAPLPLLDLVALGTIADLVPLSGNGESENRGVVREGFAAIEKGEGSSLGLRTLMSKLSINPKNITASDVGYLIAPKLNAANRAGDPKVAFLLLITEDSDQAEYLAEILLDYNRDREVAQNDLISQALQMIRSEGLEPRESGFVFLVGQYWNEGILGLVASSLADRYRVPAFVLSRGDQISRGSCRSAGAFDISASLDAQSELLLRYGGHQRAAGFSVANEKLTELEDQLETYIATHRTEIASLAAEQVDAVASIREIDLRFYTNLSSLAPYGPGNTAPHFLLENCSFETLTLVGTRRQHLKGRVTQNGYSIPFIAFRMGRHLERFEEIKEAGFVCRIDFDDWRGAVQVQGVDLVMHTSAS